MKESDNNPFTLNDSAPNETNLNLMNLWLLRYSIFSWSQFQCVHIKIQAIKFVTTIYPWMARIENSFSVRQLR